MLPETVVRALRVFEAEGFTAITDDKATHNWRFNNKEAKAGAVDALGVFTDNTGQWFVRREMNFSKSLFSRAFTPVVQVYAIPVADFLNTSYRHKYERAVRRTARNRAYALKA
jgi:hypothetical protein